MCPRIRCQTILDAHVHSVIAFFFSLYAVPQTGGPGSLAGMLAVGKIAYTGTRTRFALFMLCRFDLCSHHACRRHRRAHACMPPCFWHLSLQLCCSS